MKVSLASPVFNESEKIAEFVHRAVVALKVFLMKLNLFWSMTAALMIQLIE
jgi:hypothetical protein